MICDVPIGFGESLKPWEWHRGAPFDIQRHCRPKISREQAQNGWDGSQGGWSLASQSWHRYYLAGHLVAISPEEPGRRRHEPIHFIREIGSISKIEHQA